jgi:MFS transporter, DHA1 family, inner membrane transport protein
MTNVEASSNQGSWARILLIYAIGVLGATTISQAIPVIGDIARQFHPPHSQVGWIISLPSALVAVGALLVGWIVDRVSDKPVLIAGTALVVVGDVGVALADSLNALYAARILEGVGYVGIAVAAITMMTRITSGPRRNTALTLWSSFIPMSFALPVILAAQLAGTGLWRWAFTGHAIALAVLGIVAIGLLPGTERGTAPRRTAGLPAVLRSPGPYLLGLAFACAAFVQTGIVSTLPHLLGDKYGVSVAVASSIVTLGMILNTAGCLAVGPMLNRGIRPLVITLFGVLLAVAAGLAIGVTFRDFTSVAIVSSLFFLGSGLIVGLWALLPQVAPNLQSLGATSGLVTQVTLLGVLFGPPAAFAAQAQGDWLTESRNIVIAGALVALVMWLVTSRFSHASATPRGLETSLPTH